MSQKLLKELKRKLPYKYGKLIAAKSSGVSVRRVKAVFNGEVTDPEKVLEVVQLAEQLLQEIERQNKKVVRKIKAAKSKKVK